MNVLFCGGDNWYPAIIGSKAVMETVYKLFTLRPIIDKNVLPLHVFYKIYMRYFSLNKPFLCKVQ